MTTQPDALRPADALEQQFPPGTAQHYLDGEAAAELRRLHGEVERKSDAIQRVWKERDALRADHQRLMDKHNALHINLARAKLARLDLEAAVRMALEARDRFGWSVEADEALELVRGICAPCRDKYKLP